jgi:hypothetical protein
LDRSAFDGSALDRSARSRSAAAVGEYHDLAYEADQVRAFATLRGMTLADREP